MKSELLLKERNDQFYNDLEECKNFIVELSAISADEFGSRAINHLQNLIEIQREISQLKNDLSEGTIIVSDSSKKQICERLPYSSANKAKD